jgi:hypothetical protein
MSAYWTTIETQACRKVRKVIKQRYSGGYSVCMWSERPTKAKRAGAGKLTRRLQNRKLAKEDEANKHEA